MTERFQCEIPHRAGNKPNSAPSDTAEIPMAGLGGSRLVNTQPLGSGTATARGRGVFPPVLSTNPAARVHLLGFFWH